MANPEHVERLKQGVVAWNAWRRDTGLLRPNLSHANFSHADLSGADLSRSHCVQADLSEAYLRGADLSRADLMGANLREVDLWNTKLDGARLYGTDLRGAACPGATLEGADLRKADLSKANFTEADLSKAALMEATLRGTNLSEANLTRANLSGADLTGADLRGATLVHTNLAHTTLSGCHICGIRVEDVSLTAAKQFDLVITSNDEPTITVDNLEFARFIALLINSTGIRQVIDTITTTVVLIFGRFSGERKAVLESMRAALRTRNYLPVLVDFDKPGSRDLNETISTLAHMARFVIADLTDAKSIAAELQAIVPNLPSVPVQPVIAHADYEYALFEHIKRYPWVLPIYQYDSTEQLLAALSEHVIDPAEAKVKELRSRA